MGQERRENERERERERAEQSIYMNLEPQITTQPTHHSLPGTVGTLRGNLGTVPPL